MGSTQIGAGGMKYYAAADTRPIGSFLKLARVAGFAPAIGLSDYFDPGACGSYVLYKLKCSLLTHANYRLNVSYVNFAYQARSDYDLPEMSEPSRVAPHPASQRPARADGKVAYGN